MLRLSYALTTRQQETLGAREGRLQLCRDKSCLTRRYGDVRFLALNTLTVQTRSGVAALSFR